jgi:prepilin-type N-terminal cleavage/methylation domain-containing protein
MRHKAAFSSAKRAFTLIELLVVISIVAVLAALILPALQKAKLRATVAACLNLQKQLGTAWQTYSGDNRDQIVNMGDSYNQPGGENGWRVRPGNGWTPPGIPPVTTDQDANVKWDQLGYKEGALYPYAPNLDVIHCPLKNAGS